MLNISPNRINDRFDFKRFRSFKRLDNRGSGKNLRRFLYILFFIMIVTMILPWTQNVRSKGNVTTLKPDQRPQSIHSIIAGRIEKWHVKEGDFVKKGDTILYISEIKDDYLDPDLLRRTGEQLKSKEMSVSSYVGKVKAMDIQIDALKQSSALKNQQAENKLMQARLKVISDSIEYQAARTKFEISREQFDRTNQLFEDGLKSKTDMENLKLKMQEANAYMVSAQNKLLASRNEVINAELELVSIQAQYGKEIAKAESEKYSALSSMYDAEVLVNKLQNQYMNYSLRTGMYFITAPQSGYVTKAMQSGIGETIKEGDEIVTIMPAEYDLAIEMFIKPIDLPLMQIGLPVRVQFDGWPAVVFSGWPNTSYGTFGGRIFAIDNFISENGMYRVLVSSDPEDNPWPEALRVGAGTRNIVLLKNVPVWYELWRKMNGFPPDYYIAEKDENKSK